MNDTDYIKIFKEFIESLDDSADMDDFNKFIDTCQVNYEEGTFNEIYRFMVKQAERVQELEEIIGTGHRQESFIKLYEQNKRYREALEFLNEAASQDSRTSVGTDSHFVMEIASQALESESHE